MTPEIRPGVVYADVQPLTAEQFLQRRGYSLTREDLVSALHDSRAEVRSLAAEELARGHNESALPALVEAFESERALGTQMFMASALAAFGDERALSTLRRLCKSDGDSDPAHRAAVRLLAAGSMVRLGEDACYDDVIDTLRYYLTPAGTIVGDRVVDGLTLVLGFRHVSPGQSKQLRELAETSLGHGEAGARMLASDILGRYGDAGSAQKLKQALAAETDVTAHARMAAALKRLQSPWHNATTDKK